MSTAATGKQVEEPDTQNVIISADSHVVEPHDLWAREMPWAKDRLPAFEPRTRGPGGRDLQGGGQDPYKRFDEMAVDGVSAEVLYTTHGLRLFGLDEAEIQEACFRVFNDWLTDYCRPNVERLVGVPCISLYNIDRAVRELERCAGAGLKGAMIWQAPHPDFPFRSSHYHPFWEAAAALNMPVSLHSITGHNYTKNPTFSLGEGVEKFRNSVGVKTLEVSNAVFDLIFFGVLQRYPQLKVVLVENEVGWLPFFVQQWDYVYNREKKRADAFAVVEEQPSFYFYRQVYATFFNDHVGAHLLGEWGQDTFMWSSDYPHNNSTWPHSRQVIERDLGHFPPEIRQKLVRDNVTRLYGMAIPQEVIAVR